MLLSNPIDNLPLKQIKKFCDIENVIITKMKTRKYLTLNYFWEIQGWYFSKE